MLAVPSAYTDTVVRMPTNTGGVPEQRSNMVDVDTVIMYSMLSRRAIVFGE